VIRARPRALIAISILLLLGAIIFANSAHRSRPSAQAGEKRPLLLLTSLPLMFGQDFSLQDAGSPVLGALQKRYQVVPISVASPAELAKGRLLLMAQPFAQPAEDLVALDQWVRGGGRLLLFADPMLEWPSDKPLGDATRPPIMFADTGLLKHWGLRLDAPDERGQVLLGGGHNPVAYISPGRLLSRNPKCELMRANIVAECRIGHGRVIVVADADMLNGDFTRDLKNPSLDNMPELMEMMSDLADSESK
jgi:hypothetical protein